MPIYEYRCGDCGQVFEYMQRMTDDPKTTCESCQGSLERLISAAAFHLKGGGWYKDLYASPKAESKGESKEAGSASASSDSKSSSESTSSSESKSSGSSESKSKKSSSGESA